MTRYFLIVAVIFYGLCAPAEQAIPKDEQAVQEVLAGTRTTANAAWWGFNKEDSTEFLQAAIDSGVPKLVIPYMGDPWIVRPIKLRSKLEIVFEPGVLVLAKKGEFKGGGDSLFSAIDETDIAIRGYGATLRMHKKDYQSEAYQKAEWRMTLRFMGCKRVLVEGLRMESSGGDGIYIGSSGQNRWSEDVVIRNCVCHDNHRQGISVTSAQNLLIENCILSDTSGTAPGAGIDLEPDSADERLVNCVIRNCIMENNEGHAMLVYLKPLTSESEPVSVRFENCLCRMGHSAGLPLDAFKDYDRMGWAGMAVGAVKDDGPKGIVEFINCTAENTGKEGAKVFDKSAENVQVRFVNCRWKNGWVSRHSDDGGPRVPILIHLRQSEITQKYGGVEFVDCSVYDDVYRPVLWVLEDESSLGVRDLVGSISVYSPHEPRMQLGPNAQNIDLKIKKVGE